MFWLCVSSVVICEWQRKWKILFLEKGQSIPQVFAQTVSFTSIWSKNKQKNSWEIATAKKCLGIAHSWCRNINPLSYATSKKKAYNFWIITYIHSSFSRFHSQCQIKFMYEHVLVLTRFSMSLPDTIWNSL